MTLDEAKKIFPPIYAIYKRPSDLQFPFVVRVWYGMQAGELIGTTSSLELARRACQERGAQALLPPELADDVVIVESWI
jgi:hypothetical protein